ncbi:hypothetical protein B6C97_11450 [Gilliamella apis]|nr:hypothetical protein B6C94_11495 [Gilliamella apis]OTQ40085.1 hypothetical protein B6D26_07165 [Gilliamella apis]OTQ50245.1 hypothetical protein B6C96_09190 [Gilliamella apis]OTQ54780.1 hypothetical protein B6C97_11450 [Gilliamella apis]
MRGILIVRREEIVKVHRLGYLVVTIVSLMQDFSRNGGIWTITGMLNSAAALKSTSTDSHYIGRRITMVGDSMWLAGTLVLCFMIPLTTITGYSPNTESVSILSYYFLVLRY